MIEHRFNRFIDSGLSGFQPAFVSFFLLFFSNGLPLLNSDNHSFQYDHRS
ncbi:hypothetical protein BN8_00970 [Fibrisoma limi BUZ 3]|uniref:Uncharacterized protein n=1 Tax=Fibrisoma limi BUZ 3 TaxID=1185876 RepID=I2GDM9_9BACT|nr:hypothetical protein BN8_00970 [Fibrisoma limi BUZ 3]